MTDRSLRRLLVVAVLGFVPWVLVFRGGYITVIGSVAYFGLPSLHVVPITTYFQHTGGSPPEYMLGWAVGLLVYVFAVASAGAGILDREDPRLTGGLLALLGVTQLSVAYGFGQRPTYVAIPLGTILTWGVAWWYYWPSIRSMLAGTKPE